MDESYKLKIEYVPLDKLKPYERNARKHGDKDIDAIAASIKRFGFKDPIGVWGKDIIVEGHGRLLAAKKLNLAEVPIIRLDDLTDEERRMYALAHNKTAELSAWDFDTMDTELEELGEMFDVSLFGFLKLSGGMRTTDIQQKWIFRNTSQQTIIYSCQSAIIRQNTKL